MSRKDITALSCSAGGSHHHTSLCMPRRTSADLIPCQPQLHFGDSLPEIIGQIPPREEHVPDLPLPGFLQLLPTLAAGAMLLMLFDIGGAAASGWAARVSNTCLD